MDSGSEDSVVWWKSGMTDKMVTTQKDKDRVEDELQEWSITAGWKPGTGTNHPITKSNMNEKSTIHAGSGVAQLNRVCPCLGNQARI